MSVKVMGKVWERSTVKGSSLLVLLAVADFATDEGVAFPSVETLARKARLTVRHVQRVIRDLCRSGDLAVDEGKGPRGTHLYRVTLRQDDKMSGVEDGAVEKPVDIGLNGVTRTPGDKLSGATSEPQGGDIHVTGGVTPVSPNPSVVRHDPSSSQRDPGLRREFEERFWKPFPARGSVKRYKPAAFERYAALKPEDREAIGLAVKRYARDCRDTNSLPVDPLRFIYNRDGELWRDYLPPGGAAAPAAQPVHQRITEREAALRSCDAPEGVKEQLSRLIGKPFGQRTEDVSEQISTGPSQPSTMRVSKRAFLP